MVIGPDREHQLELPGDGEHATGGLGVHGEACVGRGQLLRQPGQGLEAPGPASPGLGKARSRNRHVPLPARRDPRRSGPGLSANEGGAGVRLRLDGRPAHTDAHVHSDAQIGAGALGERRGPEAVGGAGQGAAGRDDHEPVVARRANRRVNSLRLLDQEPVHGEPHLLA